MRSLAIVLFAVGCSSPYSEANLQKMAEERKWSELADIAGFESDETLGDRAADIRRQALGHLASSDDVEALPGILDVLQRRSDLLSEGYAAMPTTYRQNHFLPALSRASGEQATALKRALLKEHEEEAERELTRLVKSCQAATARPEEALQLAELIPRWDGGETWADAARACVTETTLAELRKCQSATCLRRPLQRISDHPSHSLLLRQIAALDNAETELANNRSIGSEIPELERREEDLEASLEGALHITIWVHGTLSQNMYEVSEAQSSGFGWMPGRDRYILRTNYTSFKTTGHAKLWIRATGLQETVTLKNGGTSRFGVFEEFQRGKQLAFELATVRSGLSDARRRLRIARQKTPALERARNARLSDIRYTLVRVGAANSSGGAPPAETAEQPATPSLFATTRIEAGSFTMGSSSNLSSCRDPKDCEYPHDVRLSQAYLIGTHEVTQRVWSSVMGSNPSRFRGPNRPVEGITWFDAVRFANALSEHEGLDPAYTVRGKNVSWNRGASGWRLPTEAEWEYAARGGESYTYSGSNRLQDVGWSKTNARGTRDVGSLGPNRYGLYDMSGNVWEWVWDWNAPYPRRAVSDPSGPSYGTERCFRGGAWAEKPASLRVANRGYYNPSVSGWGRARNRIGLRLARNAP